MSDCVIALSSITYAMKGEGLLKREGIAAKQIRLAPHATRRGCAYGLAIPCTERHRAARLLRAADIPYSQILQG